MKNLRGGEIDDVDLIRDDETVYAWTEQAVDVAAAYVRQPHASFLSPLRNSRVVSGKGNCFSSPRPMTNGNSKAIADSPSPPQSSRVFDVSESYSPLLTTNAVESDSELDLSRTERDSVTHKSQNPSVEEKAVITPRRGQIAHSPSWIARSHTPIGKSENEMETVIPSVHLACERGVEKKVNVEDVNLVDEEKSCNFLEQRASPLTAMENCEESKEPLPVDSDYHRDISQSLAKMEEEIERNIIHIPDREKFEETISEEGKPNYSEYSFNEIGKPENSGKEEEKEIEEKESKKEVEGLVDDREVLLRGKLQIGNRSLQKGGVSSSQSSALSRMKFHSFDSEAKLAKLRYVEEEEGKKVVVVVRPSDLFFPFEFSLLFPFFFNDLERII